MTSFRGLILSFLLVGAMVSEQNIHAGSLNEDRNSLVQGIVARAEAVFSARMEYHYTSRFTKRRKPVADADFRVSFSGTNWVNRCLTTKAEASNYNGKMVRHITGIRNRGHDIEINRPESIDAHYPPKAPYFAGSFWHRSTTKFVNEHAAEAEIKGRGDMNGIPVIILEWTIKDHDTACKVFHGVNDLTENGGVLRVSVALQLGHALPLIEFLGNGRTVGERFEATDFVEAADGIFMPRRFSESLYDSQGLVKTQKYEVKKLEKVNEPIPEEDFIINAPPGSILRDQRPLKGSRAYKVGDVSQRPPKDLGDILAGLPQVPQPRQRSNAIFLGVMIGVLFLVVCYFIGRFRRRQPG